MAAALPLALTAAARLGMVKGAEANHQGLQLEENDEAAEEKLEAAEWENSAGVKVRLRS